MGYFQVRYDSRVVKYECKMFIRLATGKSTLEMVHTQFKKNFYPRGLCGLLGGLILLFISYILLPSPP